MGKVIREKEMVITFEGKDYEYPILELVRIVKEN